MDSNLIASEMSKEFTFDIDPFTEKSKEELSFCKILKKS